MAKVKIDVGATIDTLTKGELDDSLAEYRDRGDALEQGKVRGIKYMRAPRIIGTVYSGTVGGSSTSTGTPGIGGPPWGPQSGYAWSVMRVSVSGLAGANGTIPDMIGLYRNNPGGHAIVTLTANQPWATFGRGNLVFFGGDTLYVSNFPSQQGNSNGTLVATGNLFLSAELVELPQEMLGKLA